MLIWMSRKLHCIYIPGLGDNRVRGQQAAVNTWRLWGVSAEVVRMCWADGEPWEAKQVRLLRRIDELLAEGSPVALVGASAGASAVINAYAARKDKLVGCVLIAGKVNRPAAIGSYYYRHAPAFIDSVRQCQTSLRQFDSGHRRRILSRYARTDPVVAQADSVIEGAYNQCVAVSGHAYMIGSQIVFGARTFTRFLKDMR